MRRTLSVRLGYTPDPAQTCNENTANLGIASPVGAWVFEKRFLRHYDELRRLCEEACPGRLVIAALEDERITASASMAAKKENISVAIVGRHTQADIVLPDDDRISLRHLAVILLPEQEDKQMRFRVLDLWTAYAMIDERGQRLHGLEAEGPVFLHCGQVTLFLYPGGASDSTPWPDDPAAGWKQLPQRVYFDEVPAAPFHQPPPSNDVPVIRAVSTPIVQYRRTTRVQVTEGPLEAQHDPGLEHESPVGELQVENEHQRVTFPITASALRRGIILGRGSRCDNNAHPVLDSTEISRVHMLLLEVSGVLYGIDTASTNGVCIDGELIRAHVAAVGDSWKLANSGTSVRWTPTTQEADE